MKRDRPGWSVPAAVASLGVVLAILGLAIGDPDPRVLPVAGEDYFDAAFRARSAAYAGLKYAYWAASVILNWGALTALILLGGGRVLAALDGRMARGRTRLQAFFAALLLLTIVAVIGLPISFASGHLAEQAYGLSTRSAAEWALDWLKRQAFWTLVYAALAAGFLACLGRWRRFGWLAAAAGGVVVAVAGTFLAPRVIDPLFHDFEPLADAPLEREIVAMGERAGLDVGRVLVMDASRRTRRLNAYVTGLGATRQVVLYDNLLAEAPRDEVLLVVAHEIGHAAERHVFKGLLLSLPGIFVGAWALAALARWRSDRSPRPTGPDDPAGLPFLWLALSVLLFAASPLSSAISRGIEAGADWISLELTADPGTFVAVTQRLATTNLSPVTPPGWIVAWFYSHPPVLDRIGMAAYWRQGTKSQD